MLLNITVPVLNEETQLSAAIRAIDRLIVQNTRERCEIVIANNGSTDRTREVAESLANEFSFVRVVHLEKRGRGRAVKAAWLESQADLLSYMDVDLSTDLSAWPFLVESLTSGNYDVATGSRLLRPDWTKRGWKRESISRAYNYLVKALLHTRFSDAQCGFKAITRRAAQQLLPRVEDGHWFFDTELLVLAEKLGYRIYDLPVRWVDDPDSRVKILPTAWEHVKGLLRLRRNLRRGAYASHPSRTVAAPRESAAL